MVGVHGGDGETAHLSGLERCGSIWACPVCSAVIRAERAAEIQHAVSAHQDAGGSLAFVTLTLRHRKGDPLATTLDAALECWRKLVSSAAWAGSKRQQGLRQRYGISGYIRAVEVTYGQHGWHPHVHAILVLDQPLTREDAVQLGDELHGRWATLAQSMTGRTPDRRHGVDVQRVDDDGRVVAEYLAKMQDEGWQDSARTSRWGVGAEMARMDLKSARGVSGMSPFALLDPASAQDDGDDRARRALWLEYYAASKGRRAITWSRGLKSRYEVEDRTDDEIIEDTETATLRWWADGDAYDRTRRTCPELVAFALSAAEDGDWEQVARILPGRWADGAGPREDPDPEPVVVSVLPDGMIRLTPDTTAPPDHRAAIHPIAEHEPERQGESTRPRPPDSAPADTECLPRPPTHLPG